jgi:hypothetical protein
MRFSLAFVREIRCKKPLECIYLKLTIAKVRQLCYINSMFKGLVSTRCLRSLLHSRTCVPPLIVSQADGQRNFLPYKE